LKTPKQITSDPRAFAATFLKILNKRGELIPFRWNKAQEHFHANRTGKDLILKARQLGMSTYVQGEIFRRAVTGTRSSMTLAHDAETTGKLRIMADRFWEHCQYNNIQPARKYANASLTTYPEFDSTVSIATAGNLEVGRGGTYSDFHGSEVAFWKDAEKIIVGAMQGGNPDVILESTPNGSQGYFYERAVEALRGEGVWKLHFYSWWWDAEYRLPLDEGEMLSYSPEEAKLVADHKLSPEQIKWRRYKVKELKDKFQQEYPEDPITCFLTSGNSYFGNMSGVYVAPSSAVYNVVHEYVAGLDFGQTNDATAMPVIDITAKVQVDLLHMKKLSWAEQRSRIAQMYHKWHCSRVGAEANSIGSVNIEALQADGLNVIPFQTTNASKAEIMSDLYEGIHTDGLKLIDHPVLRHEMATFVSEQTATGIWRLAAEGDGHDDTVIALALAWWAANNSGGWSDVEGLGKIDGYKSRWS
jgi:hypothetical protein